MRPAQLPVPPALLEISSLNRLLDVAGRIVARRLTSETQEAAAARWAEWLAVAEQLGLQERHLAVALSAPSKALMISMHMASRYGAGRVGFRVRPLLTDQGWEHCMLSQASTAHRHPVLLAICLAGHQPRDAGPLCHTCCTEF